MRKSLKKKNIQYPDSLIYKNKLEEKGSVTISVFKYNEINFEEKHYPSIDKAPLEIPEESILWLNIDGIHQQEVIEKIGRNFHLHDLVQEDILEPNQRPKLEDHGKYIDTLLKMIYLNESRTEIMSEQISIIFGKNWVVSFQEGPLGDVFNSIRNKLRLNKGKIRSQGSDFLVYSMLDAIMDHYFLVIETIGEKIEELESHLMGGSRENVLEPIYHLKQDILYLRKSIYPVYDVMRNLRHSDSPLIEEQTEMYFQDIYEQVNEIVDNINIFHNMLSSMHDIYTSNVNNRMNEIIKVLTMISTIFIPLTFLAGIYGMNFKNMPELEMTWTYPAILILMFCIAISLLALFKKKKWF